MSKAVEQTEQAAPEITCFHCGEIDQDMEPLATGEPSKCCKRCWSDYKASSDAYIEKQVNGGWAEMVRKEGIEAERRAKLKAQGKTKDEPVESEKDYGNLWLVK